jgi:hypothetical protein
VRTDIDPVPDPHRGIEALQRDLLKVLRGSSLIEVGWAQTDPLTLFVPMFGLNADGVYDFYLVRLNFLYYPEWPPSAQFVNPGTLAFTGVDDKKWLPHIEGTNEIAVHEAYKQHEGANPIQLICCSTTLEFYAVRHGVQPQHVWDGTKMNFSATLAALRYGLRAPHYKGPKAPRK